MHTTLQKYVHRLHFKRIIWTRKYYRRILVKIERDKENIKKPACFRIIKINTIAQMKVDKLEP